MAKKKTEKKPEKTDEKKPVTMPREVEIGFHQGALNTLINERNGLVNMIRQIESVMQAHLKRLEELGVKVRRSSEEEK